MMKNDAKNLRRSDLLELLIEQTEENQRLMNKITQLETKLSERVIVMEQAGSIADAALGLTDVFAQAQDSADRYLESIRRKLTEAEDAVRRAQGEAKQIRRSAEEEAQELTRQTREKAEQIRRSAEEEAQELTRQTQEKAQALTKRTEAECALQKEKTQADCNELERQNRAECQKRLAEAEQKAAEIVAASANSVGVSTAAEPSKRQGFIGRLLNKR